MIFLFSLLIVLHLSIFSCAFIMRSSLRFNPRNSITPGIIRSKFASRCFAAKARDSVASNPEFVLGNNGKWRQQWELIEVMRAHAVAAVDTMGAEALAKRGVVEKDAEFRFQTLVGTMLSPQTKDQQTSLAFDNLRQLLQSKPFLPSNFQKLTEEEIEEAIAMVSFAGNKTKYLMQAADRCASEFGDDIPQSIDDLLSFRGVGPKIAYLTFTIAWDTTLGICVDTHVHRISNRLAWVDTWSAKSNGPERTRKQLQEFIPQPLWGEVNGLIVGFGQTICEARAPKCHQCLLADSCRYHNDPAHMR